MWSPVPDSPQHQNVTCDTYGAIYVDTGYHYSCYLIILLSVLFLKLLSLLLLLYLLLLLLLLYGACNPQTVLCAGQLRSQNTQAGRPSSASRGFFDPAPTSASSSTSAESEAASQGSSNRPQSLEDLPNHSTSSDESAAPSPLKVSHFHVYVFPTPILAGTMQPQSTASRLVLTTLQVSDQSSLRWCDILPIYVTISMLHKMAALVFVDRGAPCSCCDSKDDVST